MRFFFTASFLLLLLCTTPLLYAQQYSDVVKGISEKMEFYKTRKPQATLFVHFDKNIYTNNENVWLAGYLIKSNLPFAAHNALSVALMRNEDRSILAEEKFVMKNGLASGNFNIPDSLPTGDYTFIAYTNCLTNGYPDDVFMQPITIKTSLRSNFIATLNLADAVAKDKDSLRVLLKVYTTDIRLVKDAAVNYAMGDSAHRIIYGKTKTNSIGEVMINVPTKNITAGNNILRAEVRYGGEVNLLQLKLPIHHKTAFVKFYPEGGNLIDAATSQVGWEVKTAEGAPLQVSGILYSDNSPVDSFQTNKYGMGRFMLRLGKEHTYHVKLVNEELAGSTYPLPPILPDGPVLSMAGALAEDNLTINLWHTRGNKLVILLHNYTQLFAAYTTNAETGNLINIPLKKLPRGIAAITVLDSTGRPVAERLFFAHYGSGKKINFSTSSNQYGSREKVNLQFNITDIKGLPVQGIVSVACVQEARIDTLKITDIETYFYLERELQPLPFLIGPMGNRAFLEDMLLIRGWRRYTWPDLLNATPADTLQQHTEMVFKGLVKKEGKPITKPVQVGLLKMPSSEIILTDSAGHFQPSYEQLVLQPRHKLRVFINDNKKKLYTFLLQDPYEEMNQKLAGGLSFKNYTAATVQQTTQSMALKKAEGAVLPEVTVTTIRASFIGRNECGDYVCGAGVFNCPNHFEGTMPVKGQVYRTANGRITYAGCKEYNILPLRGIYTAKEFYAADYDKTPTTQPQYLSTLYWNPLMVTNANGELKVSFYTSDITGRFRVIAQGVTSGNDVVYGTYSFLVK